MVWEFRFYETDLHGMRRRKSITVGGVEATRRNPPRENRPLYGRSC